MNVNVGQIVRGKGSARFVVLALRDCDGPGVQVKEVGPNGELGRGEFFLPLSVLRAA